MALCVVSVEEIGAKREFNFRNLEPDKSYWLECCVWKGDEGTDTDTDTDTGADTGADTDVDADIDVVIHITVFADTVCCSYLFFSLSIITYCSSLLHSTSSFLPPLFSLLPSTSSLLPPPFYLLPSTSSLLPPPFNLLPSPSSLHPPPFTPLFSTDTTLLPPVSFTTLQARTHPETGSEKYKIMERHTDTRAHTAKHTRTETERVYIEWQM